LRTATNYYGPDELDAAQSIETMTLLEKRAILVGMKNGAAKVFDSEARSFKQPVGLFSDDEFGKWTGLHSVGEQLVGTSETGVIRTWSKEQFSKRSEMDEKSDLVSTSDTKAKVGVKVRQSKVRRKALVLGGEECQLQMFDLEHLDKGAVFSSKSVKPDKLQLHIPINFPAMALPDESEVIAASSYGSLINQAHELRIYDPRAVQRRPVKRIEWGKHPITALLSLDPAGNFFALGNARGKIAMIDLRNEKRTRSFKGAAGSVRCFYQHPDDSEKFGAVGLDRYLHIYDRKTCSKIHKLYLKSPLNCLVMQPGCLLEKETEKKADKMESDTEEDEENEETQKIWSEMDSLASVQD